MKKKLLIITLVVLILIIAAIACYYYTLSGSSTYTNSSPQAHKLDSAVLAKMQYAPPANIFTANKNTPAFSQEGKY
jgi:flagellar basal body-associated protein FliL